MFRDAPLAEVYQRLGTLPVSLCGVFGEILLAVPAIAIHNDGHVFGNQRDVDTGLSSRFGNAFEVVSNEVFLFHHSRVVLQERLAVLYEVHREYGGRQVDSREVGP